METHGHVWSFSLLNLDVRLTLVPTLYPRQPTEYDPDAPDGYSGGRLYETKPSPPMSTLDHEGSVSRLHLNASHAFAHSPCPPIPPPPPIPSQQLLVASRSG